MSDSAHLPIRRITFYKHGVALLERAGRVEGDTLAIDLRDEDLDVALRSLTVRDGDSGNVVCVDYETPVARGGGQAIELAAGTGMLDLLERLTGWRVRAELAGDNEAFEGRIAGLQYAKDRRRLRGAILMLLDTETGAVRALPVELLASIVPLEARFGEDLRRFLDVGKRPDGNRRIALRFAPGEPVGARELRVSYLVQAPAWRVNYRVIVQSASPDSGTLQLQGWALIDRRFDEDLHEVRFTLVAGQPLGEPTGARAPAVEMPAGGAPDAGSPIGHGAEAVAYELLEPVTVLPRGSSALVPILSTKLDYRRELLFNADTHADHPVAALHCRNTSGLVLEQGPATLFDDGRYRGEAQLPLTGRERDLYLPYAVEADIDIGVERDFVSEAHGLRIDGDRLLQTRVEIRSYRYRVVNRTGKAQVVTIECDADALPGELFECPAPVSRANGTLRWELSCPPSRPATLTLRARKPTERRHMLVDMRPQRIDALLKTAGLAPATRRALELLRGDLGRIEENEQQSAVLEAQRRRVVARQAHLRQNIGALAATGDEGEVRLKMVRELQAAEGALSGIEQLLAELADDSEARRRALLAKLPETAGEAEHSLP